MALKGDARQKLEQIKRKKGKNNNSNQSKDVRDLRQLIAKKGKPKKGDRVASGRIVKNGGNDVRSKDLRSSNKKLAARKRISPKSGVNDRIRSSSKVNQPGNTSNRNPATRKTPKYPQRQYYVPPHMQQQMQTPAPTYIIAPAAPSSNLAMDNVQEAQQGASVLISNLGSMITQSEIIELFGDLGTLTGVNMINQTTALVTYQKSSDAVKAVKVYHNRFLDGKPMYVNMMPTSTVPTATIRSRIGQAQTNLDNRAVPMDTSYIASRR